MKNRDRDTTIDTDVDTDIDSIPVETNRSIVNPVTRSDYVPVPVPDYTPASGMNIGQDRTDYSLSQEAQDENDEDSEGVEEDDLSDLVEVDTERDILGTTGDSSFDDMVSLTREDTDDIMGYGGHSQQSAKTVSRRQRRTARSRTANQYYPSTRMGGIGG